MESTSFKSRFLSQLNNSFGSGGMSLALNETQFSLFIQFLKKEGLPIKKAALAIGLQSDGPVWVLGKELQIGVDGEIIDHSNLKYIWLDEMISDGLTSVRLEEVLPSIRLPLDTFILHRLVKTLQTVMQHNFMPAMTFIAGAVLSLHYVTLSRKPTGCPITIAEGMSQTGKSTVLQVALGLLGLSRGAVYEKCTNCFLLHRASASTLPFGIDDPSNKPTKGSDFSDMLVDFYNKGNQGASGRGSIGPKSIPLVATNYKLRQEERVQSRLCIIPFKKPSIAPTTEDQQTAFDELDDILMSGELSSVCGWAIKQREILEEKDKFKAMKAILRPHFEGRSVLNWAYIGICLKEVLIEAKFENLVDSALKFVCSLGCKVSLKELSQEDASVVNQTIEELVDISSELTLSKVLEYMRTDVQVGGHQVLAVVLGDVESSLTFPIDRIRLALERGGFGYNRITKDFLMPGRDSNYITRNVNSRRRKCEAFILSKIENCEQIKSVCMIRKDSPVTSLAKTTEELPHSEVESVDSDVMESTPNLSPDLDRSGEDVVLLSCSEVEEVSSEVVIESTPELSPDLRRSGQSVSPHSEVNSEFVVQSTTEFTPKLSPDLGRTRQTTDVIPPHSEVSSKLVSTPELSSSLGGSGQTADVILPRSEVEEGHSDTSEVSPKALASGKPVRKKRRRCNQKKKTKT